MLLKYADDTRTQPSVKVADEKPDVPLPATLQFVVTMGVLFLIGWFGLFMLLKGRW